jgi:AbiV family abortive infection protein
MSQTEAIQYWIESANEDWRVAENLFRDKTYNYALFLMQLALEKLIKAIQIKKDRR